MDRPAEGAEGGCTDIAAGDDDAADLLRDDPDGAAAAPEVAQLPVETPWWGPIVGLLACLPALGLVGLLVWRRRRAPAWTRLSPYAQEALLASARRPSPADLFDGPEVRGLARSLRRGPDLRGPLAIVATVEATAAAAGRFSPVFERPPGGRTAHVLIERLSVNDHLASLFQTAVTRLEALGARIESLHFRTDPERLTDASGRAHRLATLIDEDTEAALVVVGSGDGLFHPSAPELDSQRTRPFRRWARRFLLSTRQLAAWGWREEALVAGGFSVGPASPAALASVAGRLEGDAEPDSFIAVRRVVPSGAAPAAETTGEPGEGRAFVRSAAHPAVRGVLSAGAAYDRSPAPLWIAKAALERGDLDEASAAYQEAQSHSESTGDQRSLAECLLGLGAIARMRSDQALASQLLQSAQALYESLNEVVGAARCLVELGEVAVSRRDEEDAGECFQKARDIYQHVKDVSGEGECDEGLAEIAVRRSDYVSASQLLHRARHLFKSIDAPVREARVLKRLGDVALIRGDSTAAAEFHMQAKELAASADAKA